MKALKKIVIFSLLMVSCFCIIPSTEVFAKDSFDQEIETRIATRQFSKSYTSGSVRATLEIVYTIDSNGKIANIVSTNVIPETGQYVYLSSISIVGDNSVMIGLTFPSGTLVDYLTLY